MEIPNWSNMPDGMSLAILSWEDVYIKACDELERNPTRDEILEIFDDMSKSMRNITQDGMPAQLDALITEIVTECLKSKPYDPHSMTDEELTSKKYCHECQEIQETFWEVNFCDKNPKGIDIHTPYHGNDDTCEDDYCNPDSVPVEDEEITKQYVKEHAVFEKCVECHQYFDSAGPQAENNTIPTLCQTDGVPFDEKLIVQVWIIPSVNFVWCIAELDMQTGEAFGYANLNNDYDAEWGYININDIKKNGAELTETTIKPFKEMLEIVRPQNECPDCGSSQYGYHTIKRQDPELVDDTFHLWICKNCNYQPFTNIRGLI